MRHKRSLLSIATAAGIGAILLSTMAASCGGGSAAKEDTQAQQGINLILQNQPVPVFATSAMRLGLIEVEAAQALGAPTTSFFMPMGSTGTTGITPIDQCASQGYPIPFGTQLSNPHQVTTIDSGTGTDLGGSGNVTDQMDPNGVYAGGNSSGTYVLCTNRAGKAEPRYWEGPVYTTLGSATWNTTSHSVVGFGPSELPICTLTGSGSGAHYHCVLPPTAR